MPALDDFIAEMAGHMAHTRGWSLDDATRWVEQLITLAREEYRANGAPLGDTDAGLLAWFRPPHQPPTA